MPSLPHVCAGILSSHGGGWDDHDINELLAHSYPSTVVGGKLKKQQQTATVGNFDVIIFRVMHGWMLIHEITHERLVEAVELSHELLGATTVILMTVPFTNNVKTVEQMVQVRRINDDIRKIARGWRSRKTSGVQHVLVLEYGTYYNHIIWSSAIHLGYDVTDPLTATHDVFDSEGPTFLLVIDMSTFGLRVLFFVIAASRSTFSPPAGSIAECRRMASEYIHGV